jgi:hypothetical protein
MDIQTIGRTIQLILAPVVMVSACGILLSGMLTHYAGINGRLRSLSAERLELALLPMSDERKSFARERLSEIDHQVPLLMRRHGQVHHAIVLATAAISILVVSMFIIAAAALGGSRSLAEAALIVFLVGTAALMTGVLFLAADVSNSRIAVGYEMERVTGLPIGWIAEPGTVGSPAHDS